MAGGPQELSDHPARALVERWAGHLLHDRRRSQHTARAYVATAHRLIDFLGAYRGEAVDDASLLVISAQDLRAFLADRRREGLGAASTARELSAVRNFLTYAAEQQGNLPQLPRTRAPGGRGPCRDRWRPMKRCRLPKMPATLLRRNGSARVILRSCSSFTAAACASPKRFR
ncbi:site-specific integrase [Sphingomonas daechungensis]|uniref:Site-specific integrase n=1 Tax=Sphingomonas daechungensis TaxID=1176646 RepID=A0ABX6SYT8_9SPHN|nr:site-specific integrase [Sphingomonas daechungensis]